MTVPKYSPTKKNNFIQMFSLAVTSLLVFSIDRIVVEVTQMYEGGLEDGVYQTYKMQLMSSCSSSIDSTGNVLYRKGRQALRV